MSPQNEISDRERVNASYAQLSTLRPGAAEAAALRMGATQFVEILALHATRGSMPWTVLREALLFRTEDLPEDVEPRVIAEIGRLLLLQPAGPGDESVGAAALEWATDRMPDNAPSRKFQKVWVDHLITVSQDERAEQYLDRWPVIDGEYYGYRRAELQNPFRPGQRPSTATWLEAFNEPFLAAGLIPVDVKGEAPQPFDRLRRETGRTIQPTSAAPEQTTDPLVSVIVTTYNPDPWELETAIRSLVQQTLTDIEVLLIDDYSDESYRPGIKRAAELDRRVRLLRTGKNGGTYLARNLGLRHARGVYVTGQDDDDWSHPERLEAQVNFLKQEPIAIGCRVHSFTCLPNLSRVRLGHSPHSANASSLMMLRETYAALGGYLNARKAADTELHRRAERITGRPVVDIPKPLAIVRAAPGSLSRDEFRAGWSHPARSAFRNSYSYRHRFATPAELRLSPETGVKVPQRFLTDTTSPRVRIGVLFAADWRQHDAEHRAMLDEVDALAKAGISVGVMHLESPRFMARSPRPLSSALQERINSGNVQEVLYDDEAEISLLIIRDATVLQYAPIDASRLRVARTLIVADQPPSAESRPLAQFSVAECEAHAEFMFEARIDWAPIGSAVRRALSTQVGAALLQRDYGRVIDPIRWASRRGRVNRSLPILGRFGSPSPVGWPEDAEAIRDAYPIAGEADVRILGDVTHAQKVLRSRSLPAGWTVYPSGSISPEAFLRRLDLFVLYQHSTIREDSGRSALEAMASGCLAILPLSYEEEFGDAAVYATPQDVREVSLRYYHDEALQRSQRRFAAEIIGARFNAGNFASHIGELLEGANLVAN